GDGGEARLEIFDLDLADGEFELPRQSAAPQQAGPRKTEVEIAEHPPEGQGERPFGEIVELAGSVTASDHGAHRRGGNYVRLDPMRVEGLQDADVREAARGSARERYAD